VAGAFVVILSSSHMSLGIEPSERKEYREFLEKNNSLSRRLESERYIKGAASVRPVVSQGFHDDDGEIVILLGRSSKLFN